jgi:hypothetical protein
MQRALDWYRGLSGGGKLLVGGLAGVLVVFVLSFLFSIGTFLLLSGEGDEGPSEQQPPEPTSVQTEVPDVGVEILRAEWNEDRVEVEGEWTGDISSVQCDLFEGENFAVVRWWDRAVSPTYDMPAQTFTRVFAAPDQRETGGSINPTAEYYVICQGAFPEEITSGDEARVQGTPPG